MVVRLNALCPYFAIYPIDYPLGVIHDHDPSRILDPFCGRGTTNLAARLMGKYSVGIDSSPVACSITEAKFSEASPVEIVEECSSILEDPDVADPKVPVGEFWEKMFRPSVLEDLCKLRTSLWWDCSSPARVALRGLLLGALHGPLRSDGSSSYFSNQFSRTVAFKPDYSVRYWNLSGTVAPDVDVLNIVKLRAGWYYSEGLPKSKGFVAIGDSRKRSLFNQIGKCLSGDLFDCIITSPPYCGMNTYRADQWLRMWFLGASPEVDYSKKEQLSGSPEAFVSQLREVFDNCSTVCKDRAEAFVRFGGIGSCPVDPIELIYSSLGESWDILEIKSAGEPGKGRRISETFMTDLSEYNEIDVRAVLRN